MKPLKIFLMSLIALLSVSSNSFGGDFDWIKDFNLRAEADSSGFRARLEGRFQIGDVRIDAVLGSVDRPADAYMLLRLGEISNKPIEYVLKEFKGRKSKGWGALAKRLGIKPGSKAFHDLKRSQDLYTDKYNGADKEKGKGKSKKRK